MILRCSQSKTQFSETLSVDGSFDYVTGLRGVRLCMELRAAGHHFRLLLRAHILHHQTSQQDRQWSRGWYSRHCHDNPATWSKRWRGPATGGD